MACRSQAKETSVPGNCGSSKPAIHDQHPSPIYDHHLLNFVVQVAERWKIFLPLVEIVEISLGKISHSNVLFAILISKLVFSNLEKVSQFAESFELMLITLRNFVRFQERRVLIVIVAASHILEVLIVCRGIRTRSCEMDVLCIVLTQVSKLTGARSKGIIE